VTDVTVCKTNAKAGMSARPKGGIVTSSRYFPVGKSQISAAEVLN